MIPGSCIYVYNLDAQQASNYLLLFIIVGSVMLNLQPSVNDSYCVNLNPSLMLPQWYYFCIKSFDFVYNINYLATPNFFF